MSTTTQAPDVTPASRLTAYLDATEKARLDRPVPKLDTPAPVEVVLLPGQPTFGPWSHALTCKCTFCR